MLSVSGSPHSVSILMTLKISSCINLSHCPLLALPRPPTHSHTPGLITPKKVVNYCLLFIAMVAY